MSDNSFSILDSDTAHEWFLENLQEANEEEIVASISLVLSGGRVEDPVTLDEVEELRNALLEFAKREFEDGAISDATYETTKKELLEKSESEYAIELLAADQDDVYILIVAVSELLVALYGNPTDDMRFFLQSTPVLRASFEAANKRLSRSDLALLVSKSYRILTRYTPKANLSQRIKDDFHVYDSESLSDLATKLEDLRRHIEQSRRL